MIELLVVIAIIGIIAALAIVFLGGTTKGARDTKRIADINTIGRFLNFGCPVPAGGPGTYDLNILLAEVKAMYPQYAQNIPEGVGDPKIGTQSESKYLYTVDASNNCVLYANLEDADAEVTTVGLTDPTPGGGKGVLDGSRTGENNTNKYFQISN
jgi:hypothetical protein